MTPKERLLTWTEDYDESAYARNQRRRVFLNKKFPNESIDGLEVKTLKKMAYMLEIPMNSLTKRSLIDRIVEVQDPAFPLLIVNEKGIWTWNHEVDIWHYLVKRMCF